MEIRADLKLPAIIGLDSWEWVDSPQPGVERVMLDRVGDEVAVATSFVRYAPDSHFPGHEHALGEEFIVLEGEFGDEHGRYPPGSYVRNPPGSRHVPFSEPGCLIWVKLRQFQQSDLIQMFEALDSVIPNSGQVRRELHAHAEEQVAEIVAAEGEIITLAALDQPQEILLLEGEVRSEGEVLGKWGWLRLPAGGEVALETTAPARIFWKTRPDV